MQELNFDVNKEYINKKDKKISFPIEIHVNLQQAMNKFVEDRPDLDQYKIFLIYMNFPQDSALEIFFIN